MLVVKGRQNTKQNDLNFASTAKRLIQQCMMVQVQTQRRKDCGSSKRLHKTRQFINLKLLAKDSYSIDTEKKVILAVKRKGTIRRFERSPMHKYR